MSGDTSAGGGNGSGCGGLPTAAGASVLRGDITRGELIRTIAGAVGRGEATRTTAGEKVVHGEKPNGIAVVTTWGIPGAALRTERMGSLPPGAGIGAGLADSSGAGIADNCGDGGNDLAEVIRDSCGAQCGEVLGDAKLPGTETKEP